jgi:dihydrofolate synthase/folylpolyglutamate synthase
MSIAAERGAPVTEVGRDYTFWTDLPAIDGQRFTVSHDDTVRSFMTNLVGRHQAINATVAIATLEHVGQSIEISDTAMIHGLRHVNWPGRLEVASNDPLIVLDAAHNRASASVLRDALTTIFNKVPLVLVFGAKADKDINGMLEELLPVTQVLIITQALDSRAEDPQAIADFARGFGYQQEIVIEPLVGQALRRARSFAMPDGFICVTGSLYVVGEARTMLNLPVGQAMRPTPPSKVND